MHLKHVKATPRKLTYFLYLKTPYTVMHKSHLEGIMQTPMLPINNSNRVPHKSVNLHIPNL